MRKATMAKPKIATAALASCFGCHMSLLDIDERILELVDSIKVVIVEDAQRL